MAFLNSPQSSAEMPNRPSSSGLSVSAHDRAASLLIALLIIVGTTVVMLFIMWWTNRVLVDHADVAVEYIEPLAAGDALGDARDLDEPGVEEVEDFLEPDIEDTIEAVTDVLATHQADLESLDGSSVSTKQGSGGGQLGEGGTADIVPRWQRWQILFSTVSLDDYARQLDFFGIELAAVGGGETQIDYAYHLSKKRPDRREGPASEEQRMYFVWRHGPLQQSDKRLLQRAGINIKNKASVQFFPPPMVNMLAKIENEYADGLSVESIAKTVFGVKPTDNGYSVYVVELKKRRGR